jgi:hypothetical protein
LDAPSDRGRIVDAFALLPGRQGILRFGRTHDWPNRQTRKQWRRTESYRQRTGLMA